MSPSVSLTVVPGSPETVSCRTGSWPPERNLLGEASDPITDLGGSPILASAGESRGSSESVTLIGRAGR